MNWTPENLIALAGVGTAVLAALLSATVALTAVRLQQQGAAANRRRDAHLRFWQSANTALRLIQTREASMRQSDRAKDLPEAENLDATLREVRATYNELEIVSPRVAPACAKALTDLELARLDVQNLAASRAHHGSGYVTGADLKRAMDAPAKSLDSARRTLNAIQRAMATHEVRGRVSRTRA